jgi:hypothetical protein
VIRWQEMLVAVKKTLYPCFLAWISSCFPCSMDMLAFHACFN